MTATKGASVVVRLSVSAVLDGRVAAVVVLGGGHQGLQRLLDLLEVPQGSGKLSGRLLGRGHGWLNVLQYVQLQHKIGSVQAFFAHT